MGRGSRMTKQEAESICNNANLILEYYGGSAKSISKFKCLFGHTWETTVGSIKHMLSRCPKCASNAVPTKQEASEYLLLNNIVLLEYSGTASVKSKLKCSKCNHVWEQALKIIKQGHGCPNCAGLAVVTEQEAKIFCDSINYTIENYGGTSNAKSLFKCSKGHLWETTLKHIRHSGQRCPKCTSKYNYNGITFDSSWELIFYLYHIKLGNNPIRIIKGDYTHALEYYWEEYEGVYKPGWWFPDFIINNVYYEIKDTDTDNPNGYWNMQCKGKRKYHPEVIWIDNNDISKMREIIGDVSKYRQN